MPKHTHLAIILLAIAVASAALSAPAPVEPFLEIKINVPRALKTLEGLLPDTAKADEAFQAKLAALEALHLSGAYLFLYPDADYESLPILMLTSADPTALRALLSEGGPLAAHVDQVTASSYTLKPERLAGEDLEDLPLDAYRIWVSETTLLFAPISIATSWSRGAPKPMTTQVARTLAALQSDNHALSCAVQISKTIGEKDWDDVAGELPIPNGEGADVIATVGSELLAEMTAAFSKIESFAFGFHLASDGQRAVEYAQQFQSSADIAALFSQITQGTGDGDEPSDLIGVLFSILHSDAVTLTPALEGNRLGLDMRWAKEADETVVQALGGYVMGKLMSAAMGGMGMMMSSADDGGPVETKYTTEPDLQPGMTREQLEKIVGPEVLGKLFRGHYFESGDTPHMTMTLDPLELPNLSMTEMTYKVVAVTSADDNSVMRPDDRDIEKWGPRKIHLSHNGESQIEIPVQKGTPADALDRAIVHIDVTAPTGLVVLEFSKDEVGSKQQEGGISVSLRALSDHSVSIGYTGGKDAEIIAFDVTGGCLDSRSAMSSGSSKTRDFCGVIDRIKVAVAAQVITFGIDLTCELAGGEKEALPEAPSDAVRARYDSGIAPSYTDYSEADLDGLQVEWKEAGEAGWQDKLVVPLPHSPFSGSASWELHFLGPKGNILLKGDSQSSPDELAFSLEKGTLAAANAVTGTLKVKANTAIQTLSFTKATVGATLEQSLPSGKKLTVTFDKNTIALKDEGSKVPETRAYAENGRRLKADWHSNNDRKAYWGVPVRFEVDVSDAQIERTIPFTLVERPVADAALDAFKQRAEQTGAAARALRALQTDTRRTRSDAYDDTVAGFYYLHDRKGNPRELKLIPEALAHSDPAGAERYGYTVEPYLGYHFMRLKGTLGEDGAKQDNVQQETERTYTWDGGEFQFKPFSRIAGFVAIPADKELPTICLSWNEVYCRYRNGEKTEYLEQSLYNTEWISFPMID